mgnify:CR=1 FL=1
MSLISFLCASSLVLLVFCKSSIVCFNPATSSVAGETGMDDPSTKIDLSKMTYDERNAYFEGDFDWIILFILSSISLNLLIKLLDAPIMFCITLDMLSP